MLARFIAWLRVFALIVIVGIGVGIESLGLNPTIKAFTFGLLISMLVPGVLGEMVRVFLRIVAVAMAVNLLFTGDVSLALICAIAAISLRVYDLDIVPVYMPIHKPKGALTFRR